jgi:conjugative transfer signal peptidase TraF
LIGLFNSILRLPRLSLAALAVSGCAFAAMLASVNLGLVFNDTHSAPFGLYIEIAAPVKPRQNPAPYIFFCPDVRWPSLKNEPNYRSSSHTCPDGFSPLIKPVIAWPGDTVETSLRGITVNGVLLAHTVPLDHDSQGRTVHPFPYGIYHVQSGQLWAVSSFSPRSFDSRYFGPIPMRSVHLWIRPLLVEKKYRLEGHSRNGVSR